MAQSGRAQIKLHLDHGDCLVCHETKAGCCDTSTASQCLFYRSFGGGVSLFTCHRMKGLPDPAVVRYRKLRGADETSPLALVQVPSSCL